MPDKKVPGRWLTDCPVDLGELYLHENWSLLSPMSVHSYYSVLATAVIKNRNSTGAMLSPCLTTTLKSMYVSTLTMMRLTMLLLYMRLIAERSIGGAPYFSSMAMISEWLEVPKALTRSANATHIGRLWFFLRCRSVLNVNVISWHPTTGVDPNWHFRPCLLIILNSRPHMMLL